MRIVLDLGTSYAWRRPAVGIVRTERKFAEHLLARTDLATAFCRFDPESGRHVAVARDEVEAIIKPAPILAEAVRPPEVATAGERHPSSVVGRAGAWVKGGVHAALRGLPESIRTEARSTLDSGRDFAKGSARLALRGVRRVAGIDGGANRDESTAPVAPPADPFAFVPDDIYVSMGLDWEFNDLSKLQQARREVGFKMILFCYDTIPVQFPYFSPYDMEARFRDYLAGVARTANRVVAISECSRSDFLRLLKRDGIPAPAVDVVRIGTDLCVPEQGIRPPSADIAERPFALCVGTIESRKNHEALYHVWDRLGTKHGDSVPSLVIVGMVGWGVNDLIQRIRNNPRTAGSIRILNEVGDGELVWLYRNCLFTVYPSHYEGWGLPVVESLALGKPCIVSNTPAVLEASQGMATALDPLDVPGWVGAVVRLWLDDAARAMASRDLDGRFRAQTWRDFGEAIVGLARRLQDDPNPTDGP